MTAEQQATFDKIKLDIDSGVDIASNLAAQVEPQYAPLIYLGATALKQTPDLYADIAAFIDKDEPTDDEEKALAVKIAALQMPENL